MKRFLLAACVLLMTVCAVSAQESKAQKDRRAKLEKEIAVLNEQLKKNASRSSSALTKLSLTRSKISARKELLSQSEAVVKAFDDSLARKQAAVDEISARLDTMSFYYNRLVKNAYKNRDPRIWYMYMLSGATLDQVLHRYTYLKDLSGKMNERARKIQTVKAELELEKEQLVVLRKEAGARRDLLASELKALKADEASVNSLVKELGRQKSKYQRELADKKRQMEALNKQVAKIISSKSKQNIDYKLAGEFEANKGKLPWPVDGRVVEGFGQHYHSVYKNVKLPFNNGVNISVSPGTAVKAVFNGVVRQIIVMPGYNQCVLVQHGNYFTFYCKLKSVSVKSGTKVSTGQTIGTVDTIGGETQLHFQLWKGREPQDPESWLR